MKATSTLRPSASSPFSVLGPSASTSPFLTFWPFLTIGLLVDAGAGVRAHELAQRIDQDALVGVALHRFRIGEELLVGHGQLAVLGDDDLRGGGGDHAVGFGDDRPRVESRAALPSMPVPTSGASETSSGTPWRCMFEPMSARLASSCSRNGIRPAATETSCFGETSM